MVGLQHRGWKSHALPIFSRVDGNHMVDWNHHFARDATKTCLELDEIIAQREVTRGVKAGIEDNLVVFDKLPRHLHRIIHGHRQVGSEAVVTAPFVQRPDEIRACRWHVVRNQGRHGHLRMTFSEGVSASM